MVKHDDATVTTGDLRSVTTGERQGAEREREQLNPSELGARLHYRLNHGAGVVANP
jgi:hypothetical protein